jgi:hypothetical protein
MTFYEGINIDISNISNKKNTILSVDLEINNDDKIGTEKIYIKLERLDLVIFFGPYGNEDPRNDLYFYTPIWNEVVPVSINPGEYIKGYLYYQIEEIFYESNKIIEAKVIVKDSYNKEYVKAVSFNPKRIKDHMDSFNLEN